MATNQTLAPRTEDMIALVAGLEARGETKPHLPEATPAPITFISDDTAEMLLKIALVDEAAVRPEALAHVEDDFSARKAHPSYLRKESLKSPMLDQEQGLAEEQNEHPLYIITLMKQKLQDWKNAFHSWNQSLEKEAQRRANSSQIMENPAE